MPDFIYLASQSPRRSQLLEQLGVCHELLLPNAVGDEPEDAEGGRASAPAPAYATEHRGESLSEAQREQIVEAVLRQIRQGSSWSNT